MTARMVIERGLMRAKCFRNLNAHGVGRGCGNSAIIPAAVARVQGNLANALRASRILASRDFVEQPRALPYVDSTCGAGDCIGPSARKERGSQDDNAEGMTAFGSRVAALERSFWFMLGRSFRA